ncbi:hypothetical protein SZ63_05615 [Methanoculleus sediminis]|uniref:Uncharacterized protein n=1 Tax=Methanoculleus sediminis TaxID=1550566 RepID=A0A0H1R754_9EURY|nr:hypothetical protein [Methanoculleus sediminis]KLK88492.1 hypothetical protein SZ63_05615 [Methanoculleus sediminis]
MLNKNIKAAFGSHMALEAPDEECERCTKMGIIHQYEDEANVDRVSQAYRQVINEIERGKERSGQRFCNYLSTPPIEFLKTQCENVIDEKGRKYSVSGLIDDLLFYMITDPNRWYTFMDEYYMDIDEFDDDIDEFDELDEDEDDLDLFDEED